MVKRKLVEDETLVIGTVKRGNRVTRLIVTDLGPGIFRAALDGLLHKPIIVAAVPVTFDLTQGAPEVAYVEPQ